ELFSRSRPLAIDQFVLRGSFDRYSCSCVYSYYGERSSAVLRMTAWAGCVILSGANDPRYAQSASSADRRILPCAARVSLACSGEILARAMRMEVLTSPPEVSNKVLAADSSSPVA